MLRPFFIFLFGFSAIGWLPDASAQTRFRGSDATVQALAMGGAGRLAHRSPGLIHYNPAAARSTSGADGSLWFESDDWTGASVSAGRSGRAVSLRTLTLHGPARPSGGHGIELTGAAAWTLFDIDVGLAATLVERRLNDERVRAVRLGAGALMDLDVVDVGLALHGLGRDEEAPSIDLTDPAIVHVQVSTDQKQVGPLDMAAAFRLSHAGADTFGGGGLEISYWPVTGRTFRFMVGLADRPDSDKAYLSLGASFSGDNLTFEYAVADPSDIGLHRFGVRWR